MLRIIESNSAAQAKAYFSTADYYSEGQELVGQWRGEGAARLGLSGAVDAARWDSLCDNRDPNGEGPLTPRLKEPRRVGYDFNFHVPKSVSLLYALTEDERLLDAFRDAVGETMQDMETEMQTRVRTSGRNEDRTTGNMVWGEFVHFTTRPVDGLPDPHLHAHCYVFNTTFDAEEDRWKAGQFGDLKRDAPYFEAKFHSRLGRNLAELGVGVERTKTGWEIAGLGGATLDKFSRRTKEIEALAEREGVIDAAAKSALGAKTRKRKEKDVPLPELRREWFSRLSQDERDDLARVASRVGGERIAEDVGFAKEAVAQATEHCFERKSVLPERTLLAESLKRSVGRSSVTSVEKSFAKEDLLTRERGGRRMTTTRDVLAEEQKMIAFARDGRGTRPRL
ncbi:MAG TPA: MobF family relaxase, partial [Pirellulales bacterium]